MERSTLKQNDKDLTTTNKKSFWTKIKEIWKDSNYLFDTASFLLTIVAIVYLTFVATNYYYSEDPDKQYIAQFSIPISILLLFGLVGYIMINTAFKHTTKLKTKEKEYELVESGGYAGYDVGKEYTKSDINITIMFVSIFIVAEALIQQFSNFVTLSIAENASLYMFYVSVAIAETIIFSVIFQMFFEVLTKRPIIGILAHAIGFVIYHSAIYGNSPNELVAVFLSGFIFAFAVKFSKRLSVPIFIHIITNIIATGLIATIGG